MMVCEEGHKQRQQQLKDDGINIKEGEKCLGALVGSLKRSHRDNRFILSRGRKDPLVEYQFESLRSTKTRPLRVVLVKSLSVSRIGID